MKNKLTGIDKGNPTLVYYNEKDNTWNFNRININSYINHRHNVTLELANANDFWID